MDRDQLAALLQTLASEPTVPRKTARAVRCGVEALAGSNEPNCVHCCRALHALASDDALAPQVLRYLYACGPTLN